MIFSMPGPLKKFEAEVLLVVDQLREFEQLRQYIAHDLLVIYPKPDGITRISFRAYCKPKGSGPILGEMSGSLEVLYAEDKKLREYDHIVVALVAKICTEANLSEIS